MSSLSQEKLSEEVSKDHAAAENEPEVHVDNNQAEEDDRTKPLLERLKALEVDKVVLVSCDVSGPPGSSLHPHFFIALL